jgi:hypothetical protein
VHATALITRLTDGAGVVRSEKRTDDELAGLDVPDCAADLFDYAAVLVAHRGRLAGRVNAAIVPQVGPAHAGGRDADDGIRRLDDFRLRAILKADVVRAVKNCSSNDLSPSRY